MTDGTTALHGSEGDVVLYSTRTCTRCGSGMHATRDRRERRVWRCLCGAAQR